MYMPLYIYICVYRWVYIQVYVGVDVAVDVGGDAEVDVDVDVDMAVDVEVDIDLDIDVDVDVDIDIDVDNHPHYNYKHCFFPFPWQVSSCSGGKWTLFGRVVCKDSTWSLLGISRKRGQKLLEAAKRGMMAPPMDQRRMNARPHSAWLICDAFFHHLWEFVAEPLAETEEEINEEAFTDTSGKDLDFKPLTRAHVEDVAARAGIVGPRKLPIKWIQHCKFVELWEQFEWWHQAKYGNQTTPSFSTFYTVWMKVWKTCVKVRGESQHARCDECSIISRQRSIAQTQDEKDALAERHRLHLQEVFADRAVDERNSNISHESCCLRSVVPSRLIKIDLDGMDQAKFKLPRNLASSHEMSKLWRPQVHLVGVLAYGVSELYYSSDTDTRKDSNAQRTILSAALDKINDDLSNRGLTMPGHILFKVLLQKQSPSHPSRLSQ